MSIFLVKESKNFLGLLGSWINKLYQRPIRVGGMVVLFFLLNYFLDFTATFFLMFLAILIVFKIDGRVAIFLALLALILAPILLISYQELWAEQSAIYAFGFLLIGVIVRIVETRRQGETDPAFTSKTEFSND